MLRIALDLAGSWFVAPPADDVAREARIAEMHEAYRSAFPDVPEVDVVTLQAWLDAGQPVVLVDAPVPRGAGGVHVAPCHPVRAGRRGPGSVRRATVDRVLHHRVPQRPVGADKIGGRTGSTLTNLAGSVLAWTFTGRELQGPDGPTRRVHVYARTWDLARTDYTAVW